MMSEKTPLEMLNEVKDALDFQMVVMQATGSQSISLSKEQAYVCLVAIENLISKYSDKGDTE